VSSTSGLIPTGASEQRAPFGARLGGDPIRHRRVLTMRRQSQEHIPRLAVDAGIARADESQAPATGFFEASMERNQVDGVPCVVAVRTPGAPDRPAKIDWRILTPDQHTLLIYLER
jgi:hypothetical protein